MSKPLLEQFRKTGRLPSPPGAALQILQLCQSEDVSIADLSDTLAADPALSLRLLKYANSALVGAATEITNVRDAVMRLGVRAVRMMALSFSLVTQDDPHVCKGFEFDRFWAHSLACGVCARQLASRGKQIPAEEAFAAGLLSHIGKLVFAMALPKEYPSVLHAAGGTLGRTERDEATCLGCSHHALGADLLLDWGIPARLAEAVRHQREPGGDTAGKPLANIVATATEMADIICGAASAEILTSRQERLAFSPLFQNPEAVSQALQTARAEFDELARILQMTEHTRRSAVDIQAEAGSVLTELSLAAQLQQEAVRRENETLTRKATTDGLTGIANRAAFDERLAALWREVCARQVSIAVLLIDVDHFKRFNDTYGHQTGDAVLKAVARCLPACVRQVDFVARYGGEEFIVVLPNADRLTTANIAVKLRKAVEACQVQHGDKVHHVTVSVGAALLLKPGDPMTPKMLVETADKQLYASKHKGRNCCSMKEIAPALAQTAAQV